MSVNNESVSSHSKKNLTLLTFSYLFFGFLPIYWSLLAHLDAYTILFHRCLWTFVTLIPFVLFDNRLIKGLMDFKGKWILFLFSTTAISVNWLTYIYAVTHHHMFEASLAYFMAPLISVGLSCLIFKENLNSRRSVAIALAGLAILFLLIAKGILPTYALLIAFSFSVYGVLGRLLSVDTIFRITFESLLISLFFMAFFQDPVHLITDFFDFDRWTQSILVLSGIVSIIPLFLYIRSVKAVPFSTVGIMGFILPTMIFLVGIFYFKERMDQIKLFSLLLLWPAIGLYIYDLFQVERARSRVKMEDAQSVLKK